MPIGGFRLKIRIKILKDESSFYRFHKQLFLKLEESFPDCLITLDYTV